MPGFKGSNLGARTWNILDNAARCFNFSLEKSALFNFIVVTICFTRLGGSWVLTEIQGSHNNKTSSTAVACDCNPGGGELYFGVLESSDALLSI